MKTDSDINEREMNFSADFHSELKDVAEFCRASWKLSDYILDKIECNKSTSSNQLASLFILGKSQRLLRTIYKLTCNGYWPEAEILLRTYYESFILLLYLSEDKTQQRAKLWLDNRNPKKWEGMSNMLEKLKTKDFLDGVYTNLSMYPHNNVMSLQHYVVSFDQETFSIYDGPISGEFSMEKSEKALGSAAHLSVAICSMASREFKLWEEFKKRERILSEMAFAKKARNEVEKLFPEAKSLFV